MRLLEVNYVPLQQVVDLDYCIGCGVCAGICPQNQILMKWSNEGIFQPEFAEVGHRCNDCTLCTDVCPLIDGVVEKKLPNEDELGEELFAKDEATFDQQIGFYLRCFAGYASVFRENSSSGGLGTWILSTLLSEGIVDKVVCVQPQPSTSTHFMYEVCEAEKVTAGSKTRYYPVNLETCLKAILANEGTYAIVAIPCYIKALRLAQLQNPVLKKRIVFIVGLFCGGMKNRFFTEYLASELGVDPENIFSPEYRIKIPDTRASDYAFGCYAKNPEAEFKTLPMSQVGDMWGAGFFKPNPCDYCDDITSELADISIGDAWIPPYSSDWKGTNVVITRSNQARLLIETGLQKGDVCLDQIPSAEIVASQGGGYRHRRIGLAYRLKFAAQQQIPVPRKRVQMEQSPNIVLSHVHKHRMIVRRKSTQVWMHLKYTGQYHRFRRKMWINLTLLRIWTRIYHMLDRFQKRFPR